jgi:hypothetical protein
VEHSRDFQQVRGHADVLACRSALIDANRIYLIEQGAPNRVEQSTVAARQLKT